MTLKIEATDSSIADAVASSLQDIVKLRGKVEIVAPNSLPNDGKVIDDIRNYEA